jgi:drug/metabolite transporter superfamily protein YnfA
MYGLTRATVTLIASAVAGLLIWIATQISDESNGGYWAVYGLIAAAGLVMALSQLLGGWTKWGWPRISISVFLWALVPVAIAVLWIVVFHQPHHGLGRNHIRRWSDDIGIDGLVRDFKEYIGVLAFGLGLVFGYTFDTSGPVVRGARRTAAPAEPASPPSEQGPPA